MGRGFAARGMKKLSALYFNWDSSYTGVFVKTYQIALLKCFYFIVCKLYLNKDDFKNIG